MPGSPTASVLSLACLSVTLAECALIATRPVIAHPFIMSIKISEWFDS